MIRKQLLFIVLSIGLTSCMVGPNFHTPPSPQTQGYIGGKKPTTTVQSSGPGGNSQQFIINQKIAKDWWMLFHSPLLNQLVLAGIHNNNNVKAAQAALREAQENLNVEVGNDYYPAIDLHATASRQRVSGSSFGGNVVPASTFNTFITDVRLSYYLDFFGKYHRQVEAVKAKVDYQAYILQATYLTLTANIVTAAINDASVRAEIKATEQLIALSQQQLQIIQHQYSLGGASYPDVLSQQTQLAQLKATLPPLQNQLALIDNALAVLIGVPPGVMMIPSFNLNALNLPTKLPVSLPGELVKQRPDISASIALLHSASAEIGVNTANLFPQITLTGGYGFQAAKIGQLFNPGSVIWDITSQAIQPLFHGGALHAARRASIAAFQQSYAQYKQTVLEALQNVTDVLRALQYDAETLQAQTLAEDAAKKTFMLNQGQYKLGAVSYLSLLDAERQYQQTVINRIQAQAARYVDTANLFQALGGGWWGDECLDKKTT